ncbi:MAG: bifunctional diguanylate cyclase/phosphodiesterase [Actinomycetota bacterium]|nr:bifunctional diguanylate cyclase/phosphodiesterase [Actinomycetota bacterium]
MALLGAVLLHGYRQQAVQEGLEHGRAQAAVIEEMAVAPALRGTDLASGLSPGERDRLQSATDLAIFKGSVARLRLRSFTGQVVFSDDGATQEALPSSDPAFRAAADGGTVAAVLRDPQVAPGQVIRVLQPVLANASGQATGVLEVYLPYDAIAAKVQDRMHRTVWTLAAGLACLYALLGLVSWYTTRSLRRHAAQREHEALHDGLTGLPNREWFRAIAEKAVERGSRGETGALVLVDLDRFKEVNDTLGHHAGDELLRIVGSRLTQSLRTDDSVARLGGDEFGLVLPRATDQASVLALLTRVREELAEEIVLDSTRLSVEASFGVAFYPQDADNVEELLKCADAAMYQGKRGASGIVLYNPADAPVPTRALSVQRELRQALERDELVLHYQPKIELVTGRICGVEALVRWAHPERGLLAPADFLPVAEQSGLIEPLTAWVIRRALADQSRWTSLGVPWTVAVNVSAHNLESASFPAMVAALLAEMKVGCDRLHLEVTETALALDATVAARAVTALADQGIAIAIDDFGIGYTSLRELRTLPVAEVKVDRVFVSGIQTNDRDRAIVRSIIDLSHSLGCLVTAEGVESEEVADWLTSAGCDHAQGYYFARPEPWADLARRVSNLADTGRALQPTHRVGPARSEGSST